MKENKFDILIEYPFTTTQKYLSRRHLLSNSSKDANFTTLFENKDFKHIETLKLDKIKLEIMNLYKFYSNKDKIFSSLPEKLKIFEERYEYDEKASAVDEMSKREPVKKFDYVEAIENIKKSEKLTNKVIELFLKQNYEYLFSGKRSISLLTSKENFVTVKLIPGNSKPFEE